MKFRLIHFSAPQAKFFSIDVYKTQFEIVFGQFLNGFSTENSKKFRIFPGLNPENFPAQIANPEISGFKPEKKTGTGTVVFYFIPVLYLIKVNHNYQIKWIRVSYFICHFNDYHQCLSVRQLFVE